MHLKHLPKDFVVLVYAHDKNLWTGHKIDAVKAYWLQSMKILLLRSITRDISLHSVTIHVQYNYTNKL